MLTRSRGFGGFLATLAALSGAWLIVGGMAVRLLPASVANSITTGSPLNLEIRHIAIADIAFFWGVGALIVFFAALALGRFSIAAAKDSERLNSFLTGAAAGAGYQPAQAFTTTQPQYAADPFASYSPGQHASPYPSEPYQPQQYPSQYPAEQPTPTLSGDQ